MSYDPWIAEQVHQQASTLRGQLLDAVCMMEWAVDKALVNFFGITPRQEISFRAVLLGRMTLSNKADALQNALVAAGAPTQADVMQAIRRAIRMRNLVAHGPAGTSEGTFVRGAVYFLRTSKGLLRPVEVTLDGLEREVENAKQAAALVVDAADVLRISSAANEEQEDPSIVKGVNIEQALDEGVLDGDEE